MDSRTKALQHFRKEKRMGRDSMEFPVKKVSVMADSEEGLEEGLEKAKEIVEKGPESLIPDMSKIMDKSEDHEESEDEYVDEEYLKSCSQEDLVQRVMKLQEKLKEKE
jgi:hypothetical protein